MTWFPTWNETIVSSRAAAASFGGFTTAKTVINAADLFTLPPDFFEPGRKLQIDVIGGIGTLVTTPGTITFQVMLGSVIAFTTGAMQLNATAHTNLPFWMTIRLKCRASGDGTTANLIGLAIVHGAMFTVTATQVDGVNSQTVMVAPKTAMAVGTGFDSTVANKLDFFAGFSVNDAANTVKIEDYEVTVKK